MHRVFGQHVSREIDWEPQSVINNFMLRYMQMVCVSWLKTCLEKDGLVITFIVNCKFLYKN